MSSPRSRSPQSHGIGLGHPSSRGRQSGLKSRGTQILALRFGWVVLVIWFEVGEFFHSLSSCKFPDSALRIASGSTTQPTHVVLLADPHVPHPQLSYSPDARRWVNILVQALDELFMRKSWNVVMRLGRVDAVIVVGDMLDWGRGVMSDAEYEAYYGLYHSIFRLPDSIPMYYVPGNHDLPLGTHRLFSPRARERYAEHFSPPNALLPIANHTFIMLDAVSLVEEDYRRYAAEMQFGEWEGVEGGVIEFVKSVGDNLPIGPKILISHIPLARAELASCGPLRERGRIVKGAGPGYQNLLGSETTRFLLEELDPSIVFSGDDHDYCDYTHYNGVREVTVKSFSSYAGIRRPGLQLLSLVPPPSDFDRFARRTITHADRPCFLPDQLGVYYRIYIPLAVLTVLYLLTSNIRSAWMRWNAQGHSIYGDLKMRLSPGMADSEKMPSATPHMPGRRHTERPVPMTLPSRRSQSQLVGMTSLTPTSAMPRSNRRGSFFGLSADHLSSTQESSRSAPMTPTDSPRASFFEERYHDDPERDVESRATSPSTSRRSSYIYMNGMADHQTPSAQLLPEASHYFAPIPSAGGSSSLGLLTSNGYFPSANPSIMHRTSSSNLSQLAYSQPSLPQPVRRVTMPRLMSTQDWTSAAKAKEKSVLGLMADSLPGVGAHTHGASSRHNARGGPRGIEAAKSFLRWMWRARNSTIGKSWREVVAVAWPCAVVWVLVNALFFLS